MFWPHCWIVHWWLICSVTHIFTIWTFKLVDDGFNPFVYVSFSICLLFLSYFLQCKRRKATPACKMRRSRSLTHYKRWKLSQTQCPSFKASYRHVKICGRSEMKSTVSWSNKPIMCLSPTAPPTAHTGICSPAWAAPSCPAVASSDTSDSTWKGMVATLLSYC